MRGDDADGGGLHFGGDVFGGEGGATSGAAQDGDVIFFEELEDFGGADGQAVQEPSDQRLGTPSDVEIRPCRSGAEVRW